MGNKQGWSPITKWVVGIFVGIMALPFILGDDPDDGPDRPPTPFEIRQNKLESGFSAWNGSHRELTRWIKKNLKDPDSYEHIETKYVDEGEDEITVVTRYRARNSFGGMTVEAVVAKADIDGSIIEIVGHQ